VRKQEDTGELSSLRETSHQQSCHLSCCWRPVGSQVSSNTTARALPSPLLPGRKAHEGGGPACLGSQDLCLLLVPEKEPLSQHSVLPCASSGPFLSSVL
jgi:hypothetical protein